MPSAQKSQSIEMDGCGGSHLGMRTQAIICAIALITGYAYFLHFGTKYEPDSPTYIVPAQNLLDGHGFRNSRGYPETTRTPGYPMLILPFLAAGVDLKYLVILQHLMRVGVVMATTVFAFLLTRSYRQAVLTAAILIVDLPLLSAANSVLSEMFFTVVLCLGMWLLWRAGGNLERAWFYSLLCGVVCGASVLIRPAGLFFFVPAAFYLLLARKGYLWRAGASFVIAFSVLPGLWAVRNYRETGYLTVSSISGYNLLVYRAAGVLAIDQPGDFQANLEKQSTDLKSKSCADLTRVYQRDCAQIPSPVLSDYAARLAYHTMAGHPMAYLRLAARGAAMMMLGNDAASVSAITGMNAHLVTRVLLGYTVPLLCFALIGFVRFWKEHRHFFYLAFLTVGYFVAVSAGGEAYSRFRVPITPVYVIVVASGVDWVWQFFKASHQAGRDSLSG